MSILVATPGRLTSDSMASADGQPPWYGPKAWRMHGYLIGVAGACGRGDQRLECDRALWPERPSTRALRAAVAKWPAGAGENTTWIVVAASAVWTIDGGYVYAQKFPCAIGCGAPWAYGRLSADPDLVAAVKIACANDPNCGGKIRDLRVTPPCSRL